METDKNLVCPWWLGYFLISPLRKLRHDPAQIFGSYVGEGMNVLDFGCAMGYFSLPLARKVGAKGMVYCADIQPRMLEKLSRRAGKAKLDQIVRPVLIAESLSEIPDVKFDFVLLFAVVHEVSDALLLFQEIATRIKQDGRILFAEPKGHVTIDNFRKSLEMAKKVGLYELEELSIKSSHAVILGWGNQ